MKWENGEKEREGEERKAGRSSLAGKTRESLPSEIKGGEGDVNSPTSYPYQGNRHFTCREFKLLLA